MMNKELADYFFGKALESAQNAKLTEATRYAAISLGMNEDNENAKKLAGLCYYRIGNYRMAEDCFGHSDYYQEKMADAITKKRDVLNNVKQLIDTHQYKKAVKLLEKRDDKSVKEYNYLGCLYAVLRKKEKAVLCFSEALRLDSDNEDTMLYLKNMHQIKNKRWWNI